MTDAPKLLSREELESHNLVVVANHNGTTRCIYINNFRVVGSKPYASESLPFFEFSLSENDLKGAGLFSFRLLAEERAAAYARGLEDAAKVGDEVAENFVAKDAMVRVTAYEIAAAIRALKPGEAE